MCAYQARDEVYDALTDAMIRRLPVLLDREQRTALVGEAMRAKAELDARPHERIAALDAGQFATWQGQSVGVPSDEAPLGMEVIQNAIIDPGYFRNQMRGYYPGTPNEFDRAYGEVFGAAEQQIAAQKDERLTEPWARLLSGDRSVRIRRHDPATGKVIAEYTQDSLREAWREERDASDSPAR